MSYSPIWSNALSRVFSSPYFFYLNDSCSLEYLVNVFGNVALKSLWQAHVWGWKRGRKGGLLMWEDTADCNNPLAITTWFWFWKYVVSFFVPEKKKEREYIFQHHCETKLSLPSLHNVKVVREWLVSWRYLLRRGKGSLSLTQVVHVLWNACPTYLRKLTTEYLRGCPSTDWWISVTFCCICHQYNRCDSSGFSMLAEESLSLEISLQVSCVSSTEK